MTVEPFCQESAWIPVEDDSFNLLLVVLIIDERFLESDNRIGGSVFIDTILFLVVPTH